MPGQHVVKWIDRGFSAKNAADPRFPDGVAVDGSGGKTSCLVELEHPTARCGLWSIRCRRCGMTVVLTTAGRADDPRSVRIACKPARV